MDYTSLYTWYFTQAQATWNYLNQIISLSDSPVSSFTASNWDSLVSQIMDILQNPYILWLLLVILVVSLFNFSD